MSKTFQNITDLGGLRTDLPADKIPTRNASDCSNIDFSVKGQIQTKKGRRLFTAENNNPGTHLSGFLYKKNYGTLKRIMLRVRDDGANSHLEWLNKSYKTDNPDGQWETLVANLTTAAKMGFAAFNNTNANQLVFCNASNNFSVWTGASGLIASVTANTITIEEDVAFEGFSGTGNIMVNGTEYAYTGISGSTFTGVTPDPTTQNPAAKTGVIQSPDTTTHSANPKGNILLTSAARLWVSGVATKESQLYYSRVADATDFTVDVNPKDGGIEDFPDGGGAITLLDSKDNNNILIHKEDAVLKFRLEYTPTARVPYLDTLSLSDGAGATNFKAGAGMNQVSFVVTKREALKTIQRALDGDNLNLDSFSDQILPTIDGYNFDDASAVFYPKKRCVYVACKSSSKANYNDKVITYYLGRAANQNFLIDISIDDDFVADWILDGDDLYALSSVDQNVYKYFEQYSNDGSAVNHVWVTKEMTFDEPARLKNFNKVYVEGFIRTGTKIKISVLYGILGSGGEKSEILEWNDNNYVTSQKISALGTDVIGTTSLGASSTEIQDSYAFSVPIHFDNKWANRYKIKIETYYDNETNVESYWSIINISTNPQIQGIEQNKIINSNI